MSSFNAAAQFFYTCHTLGVIPYRVMGNSAWLQITRLAWNLGKWIAQIALPSEVVRWDWKRFRRHFVYIAAKVLKKGHRLVVRLAGSHRYLLDILTTHARLQT